MIEKLMSEERKNREEKYSWWTIISKMWVKTGAVIHPDNEKKKCLGNVRVR
jgi:hypothetical protein